MKCGNLKFIEDSIDYENIDFDGEDVCHPCSCTDIKTPDSVLSNDKPCDDMYSMK
jgi:hypothetical protein